jgi:hypothetical protein
MHGRQQKRTEVSEGVPAADLLLRARNEGVLCCAMPCCWVIVHVGIHHIRTICPPRDTNPSVPSRAIGHTVGSNQRPRASACCGPCGGSPSRCAWPHVTCYSRHQCEAYIQTRRPRSLPSPLTGQHTLDGPSDTRRQPPTPRALGGCGLPCLHILWCAWPRPTLLRVGADSRSYTLPMPRTRRASAPPPVATRCTIGGEPSPLKARLAADLLGAEGCAGRR